MFYIQYNMLDGYEALRNVNLWPLVRSFCAKDPASSVAKFTFNKQKEDEDSSDGIIAIFIRDLIEVISHALGKIIDTV